MKAKRMIDFGKQLLAGATLWGLSGLVQAATVVYEDVGFLRGVDAQSESFTISAAGTYKATLTDFVFPKSMSDIGLMVTTSTTELGELNHAGSFMFDATPGMYWASVFGVTDKPLDLGLYGIRIEQIALAPVPVPGAMLLLASALVALVGFGRGGVRVGRDKQEPMSHLVAA